MKVVEAQIENFRSLVNQTVSFSNLNVFVGNNDVGKSNILKALNLFFNNETELGRPFNFETDFTYLFPPKSHAAKQVKIKLIIEVPNSYQDGGHITWEKVWRRDGFVSEKEQISKQKGNPELSSRSRIPNALRKMKYRYVPAVKSPAFFQELLGTLYDTISVSLSDTIRTPIHEFAEVLQTATATMSQDLKTSLGIDSQIDFPKNLRELFTTLEFDTHTEAGKNFSLDYRGDGIKARHIPMILKFIAGEYTRIRTSGSTHVTTLWGYEEPENSLELSNSFALADELHKLSSEIQMFITTHSPAFYLSYQKEGVKLFHVEQKINDGESTIRPISDVNDVNTNLGLLQLVSPFIEYIKNENVLSEKALRASLESVMEENSRYKKIISDNALVDVPTIFVEGKTDRQYLLKSFELFSPELFNNISTGDLKIVVNEDFGGTTQLKNWVGAWCRTPFSSPVLALFDKDSAGKTNKNELLEDKLVKDRINAGKVKLEYIILSPDVQQLFALGIQMDSYIEHLFPVDVWVNNKDLLEDKSVKYLPILQKTDGEKGPKPEIRERIRDNDKSEYYVLKKIKDKKKTKFLKEQFNITPIILMLLIIFNL